MKEEEGVSRIMGADGGANPLGIGQASASASEPHGLWGRAFRPFFLGAALSGALSVMLWLGIWLGLLAPPSWSNPIWWHGHEMVFGFVAAAIAGFLLTASPVWSGGPVLTGGPLAALFVLWLGGRVAMLQAGALPTWLVAAIDVSFLPMVALAVIRTLWGSGQLRNYAVVGIVLVLAVANGAMHAEALGMVVGVAGRALRFAVDFVVVLVLVIGGRITPAFTRNAFRRDGIERSIRSSAPLDVLLIAAAGSLACAGLLAPRSPLTGTLALTAGVLGAVRLAGWQSWHTRRDPLLWSLHAGAAWVVVGMVLVGASDLGAPIPATSGLHALTAGAIGGTIIAVMTRVGLGHTGRPLRLPVGVVWCYALVHVAAFARVITPFFGAELQRAMLVASAVAWACAFGLFTIRYAAVLSRPRPDGQPG